MFDQRADRRFNVSICSINPRNVSSVMAFDRAGLGRDPAAAPAFGRCVLPCARMNTALSRPYSSYPACVMSAMLDAVVAILCTMPVASPTPMRAFIPKYHGPSLLAWRIPESRAVFRLWVDDTAPRIVTGAARGQYGQRAAAHACLARSRASWLQDKVVQAAGG